MQLFRTLDRRLSRLDRASVLAVALLGVVIVGVLDYLGGYEVAFSVFYLAPVAVAAWYSGRRSGVAVAAVSCISWYLADAGAGHAYSHPAIPVWNAFVRLGFFLITALLLAALRAGLVLQHRLARADGLTGLSARRAFEERLQHDLALARRRGSDLSLAFVDLGDFKSINDTRGHAEGDRVLRSVGRAMKAALREADSAARLGGDEFALVLPDTGAERARQVIDKVLLAIRAGLQTDGLAALSCSVGVVTFQQPPASPEDGVAAADALMYEVKRQGKGAVASRVLGAAQQSSGAPEISRPITNSG